MKLVNKELNVTVGLNLQAQRKAKGITLEVVGDLLGVSKASISKIELGKQNIYAAQLIILKEFYGCSYEQLLKHNTLTAGMLNEKKKELRNQIKNLTKKLSTL